MTDLTRDWKLMRTTPAGTVPSRCDGCSAPAQGQSDTRRGLPPVELWWQAMSAPDQRTASPPAPGRPPASRASAGREGWRRHRLLRLVSLLLLLAVIGSFGLGMVRISFSPAFITELQQLPGLGALPSACVSGGLATYSGLSLVAGGTPAVNAACLSKIQDTGQANLGIQPLALLAVLAVLGAAAVTIRASRGHRLVCAVLSVVAGALLVVNASRLAQVFASHFGRGAAAITSGPDLGLWVVTGLLLLVVLAQLGSAGLGWARRALAPIEEFGEADGR
jgi:hypothetical protein